jgi:predicted RNA-binding protein with EMAP domain
MPVNNLEKIERAQRGYENTGACLEDEFVGHINRQNYNELAYNFLNADEIERINKIQNPDDKFSGILKIKDRAQKYFEDTLDVIDRNKYINYENSMKLVERCQIGNPEKPNKFFSRALYNYIKERFDDQYILKFFTAAGGSHLDIKHGVDCFF